MVVLGRGAVSYERGTPVALAAPPRPHTPLCCPPPSHPSLLWPTLTPLSARLALADLAIQVGAGSVLLPSQEEAT